ncbi:methylated-DNA--[protein]-cysteine S-methyltransferase [soil metagenome]
MLPQESELFSVIVSAPFGFVGVRTEDDFISELVYLPERFSEKAPVNRIAEMAAIQIEQYFSQPDFCFDLPMKKVGSVFQQKVWSAISSIPRGEVRTYGQIAKYIQSAPRAVGQACGANWYPLVIPCHRVTAAGGLGGFAHHDDKTGFHVGIKRWLLTHENVAGYTQESLWNPK